MVEKKTRRCKKKDIEFINMIKKKTFLVTGGTGFIGSNITNLLIAKNYIILVNLKLIFLLALRLDGSVKVKSQKKKIFLKMMYLNFQMVLLI